MLSKFIKLEGEENPISFLEIKSEELKKYFQLENSRMVRGSKLNQEIQETDVLNRPYFVDGRGGNHPYVQYTIGTSCVEEIIPAGQMLIDSINNHGLSGTVLLVRRWPTVQRNPDGGYRITVRCVYIPQYLLKDLKPNSQVDEEDRKEYTAVGY